MDPNIKLGDKKFKAAKENLTTGIFQWSKDYTSAASNLIEAIKYYQAANSHQKTLEALKELIPCNEKLLDNWAVARNYETMLDIYIKHMPETQSLTLSQTAKTGFVYFKMADSADKGIVMMKRVAKEMIKKGKTTEGVQMLRQAYNSAVQEDKSFKKNELLHEMVQVYIELGIYSQAEKIYLQLIKQKKSYDSAQNGLIVVILILIQQQAKRAEKTMYELSNDIQGFLQSDDCEAADELIKAYKKGDAELFMKWTTKAAITSIFPVIIIQKLRGVCVGSGVSGQQNVLQKLLF